MTMPRAHLVDPAVTRFGVEACGYAIMINHLHLVLRNRPDRVEQWSDADVALRWRKLFPRRDDVTGELAEPDDNDLAMHMADAGRLGVDRSNWVRKVRDFGRMFKQAAGRASSLVNAAPRCSRRWCQGKAAAQVAFL